MSGLDVTIFERIFKSGNKSGNSILRTFSDSGLDVMEGVNKHADKKTAFRSTCLFESMGNSG